MHILIWLVVLVVLFAIWLRWSYLPSLWKLKEFQGKEKRIKMASLWLESNLSLDEILQRLHGLRDQDGQEILFSSDGKFLVTVAYRLFDWKARGLLIVVLMSMSNEELEEDLPRIAQSLVDILGKKDAKVTADFAVSGRKAEIAQKLIKIINGICDPREEEMERKAEEDGLKACGVDPSKFMTS